MGFGGLAPDISQCHQQPSKQDTDGVQATKKRDDDRGKAIVGRERPEDLTRGACDLKQTSEAGHCARDAEADNDQLVCVYTSKARCTGALPCEADVKAELVAGEHDVGHDHGKDGGQCAPVETRSADQVEVRGGRILAQVAAARHAVAFGIAQKAD